MAFSVVQMPDFEGIEFAFQQDTLVAAEHRGHGLGLRVKLANLDALAARNPALRRIHTQNAQENGPMLAINDALGYRSEGAAGVWQKVLTD